MWRRVPWFLLRPHPLLSLHRLCLGAPSPSLSAGLQGPYAGWSLCPRCPCPGRLQDRLPWFWQGVTRTFSFHQKSSFWSLVPGPCCLTWPSSRRRLLLPFPAPPLPCSTFAPGLGRFQAFVDLSCLSSASSPLGQNCPCLTHFRATEHGRHSVRIQ